MGRPGGPGPLDPIFDVPTSYGAQFAAGNTPAGSIPVPTQGQWVRFTVVFSEPVSGFGDGDATLSGSAGPTTSVVVDSGDQTTYTVYVSGMSADGLVRASVPAGVATSIADGETLNMASFSVDNTVEWQKYPWATIEQGVSQPDPAPYAPVVFDVTWSEAVTGFATGDVNLTASTATWGVAQYAEVTSLGDNIHFTVSVRGMQTPGDIIASINGSVCTSIATGRPNVASVSLDNTVTYECSDATVGPPFSDLFQRPDTNNFTNGATGDGYDNLGPCWKQSRPAGYTPATGQFFAITSNQMTIQGADGKHSTFAEPLHALSGPDLTIEFDYIALHAVFTATNVFLRCDSGFQDGYLFGFSLAGFGGPDLSLGINVVTGAVVGASVASTTIAGGAAANFPGHFRLSAIGTTFTIERQPVGGGSWATLLTGSDATHASGAHIAFDRVGGSAFTEVFDSVTVY
jgi:hypothetical protein